MSYTRTKPVTVTKTVTVDVDCEEVLDKLRTWLLEELRIETVGRPRHDTLLEVNGHVNTLIWGN